MSVGVNVCLAVSAEIETWLPVTPFLIFATVIFPFWQILSIIYLEKVGGWGGGALSFPNFGFVVLCFVTRLKIFF